jgi:hypothetical protein
VKSCKTIFVSNNLPYAQAKPQKPQMEEGVSSHDAPLLDVVGGPSDRCNATDGPFQDRGETATLGDIVVWAFLIALGTIALMASIWVACWAGWTLEGP